MNPHTKQLLVRWNALENGDGIRRATAIVRCLWCVGFLLCILVILAIVYQWHVSAVVVPAIVLGSIIAEANALRARLAQWPLLRPYIDWPRVQDDLKKDDHVAS